MGRRRRLQFNQREDLHPGRRTLPDPQGAVRPRRQGDGSVLRRGPLRPERSGETRWESRHMEGGIEGGDLGSAWLSGGIQPRGRSLRKFPGTCGQKSSHGKMKELEIIFWIILLDPEYVILLKCVNCIVMLWIISCFTASNLTTLVLSNCKCSLLISQEPNWLQSFILI